MIVYTRSCYQKKFFFEKWISYKENVDFTYRTNPKTNKILYPILGDYEGLKFEIDRYKGFIIAIYESIFYKFNPINSELSPSISYETFKGCLQHQIQNMFEPDTTNITKLKISFKIGLDFSSKEFLKTHMLMHKFKYYNLNKVPGKRKNFIKFDYYNFAIEVSCLKNDDLNMRFSLIFKNSEEFKSLGKLNLSDLFKTSIIKRLFELYMKRMNEITIVDKQSIDDIPDNHDKKIMIRFTNYGYWESLDKYKRAREKKTFKSLIEKYNLGSKKEKILHSLTQKFNTYLNS